MYFIMKIVPAVLTDNIKDLIKYLNICRDLGVDEIQIDICDGKFVKNTTLSFSEIKQALDDCNIKLQFHLMVENPQSSIEQINQLQNCQIYVHYEAIKDNPDNFKNQGFGLAINTKTTIDEVVSLIDRFDSILIMTVEPGFYGGKFLEKHLEKINQLRKMGFKGRIGVDGGINLETITKAVAQKPDFICSGSYLLNSEKPISVWEEYQKLISS